MPTYADIIDSRNIWIEALPHEQQTTGTLATATYDAFCCLGVASEKVPALKCKRSEEEPGYYEYDARDFGDWEAEWGDQDPIHVMDASLNDIIAAQLGLSPDMQTFLIQLNDDAKLNFTQIADVIKLLPVVGASDREDDPWNKLRFIYDFNILFTEASQTWLHSRMIEAMQQPKVVDF